ncbi:MAG TPA: hypothetical protein DEO57_01700, partial [Phycisphaerales bacterium]|nr:hypothetical protein [Phycisphaerales bacterium]
MQGLLALVDRWFMAGKLHQIGDAKECVQLGLLRCGQCVAAAHVIEEFRRGSSRSQHSEAAFDVVAKDVGEPYVVRLEASSFQKAFRLQGVQLALGQEVGGERRRRSPSGATNHLDDHDARGQQGRAAQEQPQAPVGQGNRDRTADVAKTRRVLG